MPPCLIFGATGQDGRLLARRFARAGYGVIGVSRQPRAHQPGRRRPPDRDPLEPDLREHRADHLANIRRSSTPRRPAVTPQTSRSP